MLKKIKDGDIIAFAGTGITSNLIKRVLRNKVTHVGVALILHHNGEDKLFICESTTLNNVPDISGEYIRGVQIVRFEQRLGAYNGKVYHYKLKEPLNNIEKDRLHAWLISQHTSKIQYDTIQAIASAIDWFERIPRPLRFLLRPFLGWTHSKEDLTRMFCSELAAKTLRLNGRIDKDINVSQKTPVDVIEFDCLFLSERLK